MVCGGFMGKVAFVFVGAMGLDRAEVRCHVLRIPEVSLRLRKAQELLDAREGTRFDLFLTMNSEDSVFLRYPRLKSFASAAVQLGLADRVAKNLPLEPIVLVGPAQTDSAVHVLTAQQSFEELVHNSPFMADLKESRRPILHLTSALSSLPLVAGLSPISYDVLQIQEGRWAIRQTGVLNLRDLVGSLVKDLRIQTVVLFGPGGISGLALSEDLPEGTQVFDSIELDPQLTWFWSAVNQISRVGS